MNFKLVDISGYLRDRDIFTEILVYGKFEDKYYFYSLMEDGFFHIISYQEKTGKISIENTFELALGISSVQVLNIDRDSIIYGNYNEQGIFILSNYCKKSKNIEKKDLGHLNNMIKLDENYFILEYFEDVFILNLKEDEKYLLKDKIFEDTYFDKTKKIKLNGVDYLVHNKYMFDMENLDYYLDYRSFDSEENGLYLFKFDEFLHSIKNSLEIKKDFLIENRDNFLIMGWGIYNNEYYALKLNREKSIDILRLRGYKLDIIESIDLKEYDSFENLSFNIKTLKIYKLIDGDRFRKLILLYPKKNIELNIDQNNEKLLKELAKYYFFEGFENGYFYLKVYDKDYESFLKIKGRCVILEDEMNILIYDRKNYQTKEEKCLKTDKHSLLKVLEFLKNQGLEFSSLLENMRLIDKSDEEIEECLAIGHENIGKLEKILGSNISEIKLTAYSKYRNLNEILEDARSEWNFESFEEDLEAYDSSFFKIIYRKDEFLSFSTKDEKLLKKFKNEFREII